ncbi:phage holin family protein [Streptomyces sp. NBC_00271]|uniref:phage holin family protein n=1 Tax=Streptomyces sp. NBC_00271 TaxID=2975697 RepID=UPI002E27FD4B|nr:phage holin family protein [Streptomyces sp. NBC_00271]
MTAEGSPRTDSGAQEPVGDLVHRASQQLSQLVRAVAALMAALGKRQISKAYPPAPEQTIDSVKADVAEIREKAQR